MHATTKMANLAKFRQRFGENSRMSKGARWKVTSDENGKLGKMTNLAKIRQRFGENLKVFKGASWKVVILTKMANLAKMTNSPVWSHRHVYHFGQNRHYWREPFEHIIRSSVTSLTNFAEFATFQGLLCDLIWHIVTGLTNFCYAHHFRQIRQIRQNRHCQWASLTCHWNILFRLWRLFAKFAIFAKIAPVKGHFNFCQPFGEFVLPDSPISSLLTGFHYFRHIRHSPRGIFGIQFEYLPNPWQIFAIFAIFTRFASYVRQFFHFRQLLYYTRCTSCNLIYVSASPQAISRQIRHFRPCVLLWT